jgi:hypothetical protein
MTTHSLRPISVEGEYCLCTNDLRIQGEIASGTADKIHEASLFAELPPWLFDSILDIIRTSFNKAFLPSCLDHLPTFSIDAVDLLSRTEISRACTTEVSSLCISSNLSMSGHNSPMLGLEPPDAVATISAPRELAPKENMDIS